MEEISLKTPVPGRFRIHPFEIIYLVSFLSSIIVLRLIGVGVTWYTFDYIFRDAVLGLSFYFGMGVLLQVLYCLVSGQSIKSYLKSILNAEWLVLWVRILLASCFIMYFYVWLKFSIPLITEKIYDAQLWSIDQTLHFGISPSLFFTELLRDRRLLWAMDYWYSWWLPIQLFAQGFFSASADNVFRRRYAYSQVLVWSLGVWLYIGIPALGPIYAFEKDWTHLAQTMPRNEATQRALKENYLKVLQSRNTGVIKAPFNPAYSIAAMPSLHVGLFWLFFLWSRRHLRPAAVFFGFGTVLIFIGSIVTGWHYAIDGYAGVLIAYLAYRAALLVEPQKQEASVAPAAEPAPA